MSIVRNPMTLLMLVIFSTMVGVATTYPADARFMPFIVGIPAIGLCLLQLMLDWRASGQPEEPKDTRNEFEKAEERISRMTGRQVEFEAAHIAPGVVVDENPTGITQDREFLIWGYVLGFILGIVLLGFWVAIPIFIALFLKLEAHFTWPRAIVYAVVSSSVLYAIFTYGLKLKLHGGFITEALFNA